MKLATTILALLLILGGVARAEEHKLTIDSAKAIPFAENRCFAKGGLGIIRHDLYVSLESGKNEVLFGDNRKTWAGRNAAIHELVYFFEGALWSPQTLPDNFDLSKAVVVSFEGSRVRFFDFSKASGGYYERPDLNLK